MDSGNYLDLLVFGQPVYDCDDEVFGESKVCGTDALGAVHDERQVQGCTFALCRRVNNVAKARDGQKDEKETESWQTWSRLNANLPQQAEELSGRGRLKKKRKKKRQK